jgi:hypothetical protein
MPALGQSVRAIGIRHRAPIIPTLQTIGPSTRRARDNVDFDRELLGGTPQESPYVLLVPEPQDTAVPASPSQRLSNEPASAVEPSREARDV